MVFFTCNACGESVKKNQVDKHWQQKCRRCTVLSCLDCGKEFTGDSYKEHVQCITEAEKYSGKNYTPKPSSNKGEQKQNIWLQQVQAAIEKVSANPQLTNLLQQIQEYPNIPRKKAKFDNFLKNSLRVYKQDLATKAWDMINAEIQQKTPDDASEKSNKPAGKESQDENETNKLKAIENQAENDSNEQVKKSKKEKKEERKKKQTKSEKKDKQVSNESEECKTGKKESKKQKKKGNAESSSLAEVNGNDNMEVDKTEKKKKKRKHKMEAEEVEDQEEPESKRSKTTEDKEVAEGRLNDTLVDESPSMSPFKWRSAIIRALESAPENTLSLKKLQKKVFAIYNVKESSKKSTSKEQLIGKFMKKLNASSNLKVHKEQVKLLSSDPDN